MSDRGTLEKLSIRAFTQADYSGSSIGEFEAYVNPNEITFSYEMEYDSSQGSGTTNSRMEFKKVKPGDLTLNFFIDGTGANGKKAEVQDVFAQFQTVTGYNGDIHRPNYLMIVWGKLPVRRCILKNASISYKMFRPDGSPLRATITATFTDNSDDTSRVAEAQDQSPDLTHMRMLKAGQSLPELCQEIYGDPSYYLEVAKANDIDDFRNPVAGSRIFFPPLEK